MSPELHADKKRDDLQAAIALVRGLKVEMPLQYVNFRDLARGQRVRRRAPPNQPPQIMGATGAPGLVRQSPAPPSAELYIVSPELLYHLAGISRTVALSKQRTDMAMSIVISKASTYTGYSINMRVIE